LATLQQGVTLEVDNETCGALSLRNCHEL